MAPPSFLHQRKGRQMDFSLFDKIAQNTNPEDGIVARFYDRSVKTEEVTKDGFPVFKNVCFVEIRIKDNPSEIYDQPATKEKIERFPAAYARYQLMKKQIKEGTPLEQFAFLTAGEIESLKIRGIFTVEALAELDEEKAVQLEIGRERELAQKFLAASAHNSEISSWQKQEEKYRQTIAQLQNKVEQLQAQLRESTETAKTKEK